MSIWLLINFWRIQPLYASSPLPLHDFDEKLHNPLPLVTDNLEGKSFSHFSYVVIVQKSLMNITWRVSVALCNCRDVIKSDADCEFFLWHVMHFFELFWIANWIFSHSSRDTRTSVFVKWLAAYSPENVLHMKEAESTAFRISIFSYISFSRAPRKTAWKRAPETINKSIGTVKKIVGVHRKANYANFVSLLYPREAERTKSWARD